MLRRENILITEDYMSKTTSATHFTAPGEIECFDSSIHFGKESDRVEIQNCNIKNNVLVHCSKEDTYDFETGALIALMKMCGIEKVKRAVNETFPNVAENAVNEYEEKIHAMDKENNYLKYVNSCRESAIKSLENTRDLLINKNNELIEENENLKSDCDKYFKEVENLVIKKNELIEENEKLKADKDKSWKNYQRNIQKKQDRINELQAQIKASEDDKQKNIEYYEKENKELKMQLEAYKKENTSYRNTILGGRQNGKQYTFLVDLFKKIDQKKVDAAYKEAYNNWRLQWVKPLPKRERMWDDILACGDCEHSKYVEVKKKDLEAFAKECNEKKIFSIIGYEFHLQEFWFADDRCIFQIFRKPAGFTCAKSVGFASEDDIIDYLPPMRWDLFKKGRIVVGCTEEEVPEFIEKAKRELGNIRIEKYYIENLHCNGPIKVYYHYDKDTNWLKPLLVSGIPRVKVNNHKVYYWEDVR